MLLLRILIGFVLSVLIISGIGIAHSQTDIIPVWIKDVAGFWAEGGITDSEFIETLEFLIESNVIQVNDPQVLELQKEISELKLEISRLKQLELPSSTTVNLAGDIKSDPLAIMNELKQKLPDNVEMYIQPLESRYTIGDVIQITGKINPIDPEKIEYDLGGDKLDMDETVIMAVKYLDKYNLYQSAFSNVCYVEENYCSSGGDFLLNLIDKKKPIIDDDGTISFSNSISITEDSKAGTYVITMIHSTKREVLGFDYTQPFTVAASAEEVMESKVVEATPESVGFKNVILIPKGSGAAPGCDDANGCYIPFNVSVSTGEEITWSNDDSVAHTVTSGTPAEGDDGDFDSSLIMAGGTFSVTLDESDEYPYFCMVHPWMTGVVNVN